MRNLVVALGVLLLACDVGHASRLRARFTDIGELHVGAPVQISGVKVGAVTSIKPLEGVYHVEMDFPAPAPPLPNDARARVVRARGSGEYYIELDLAKTKGPPARTDDLLPSAQ